MIEKIEGSLILRGRWHAKVMLDLMIIQHNIFIFHKICSYPLLLEVVILKDDEICVKKHIFKDGVLFPTRIFS